MEVEPFDPTSYPPQVAAVSSVYEPPLRNRPSWARDANPALFNFVVFPESPSLSDIEPEPHRTQPSNLLPVSSLVADATSAHPSFGNQAETNRPLNPEPPPAGAVSSAECGSPAQQLATISCELLAFSDQVNRIEPGPTLDRLLSKQNGECHASRPKSLLEDILQTTQKFVDVLDSVFRTPQALVGTAAGGDGRMTSTSHPVPDITTQLLLLADYIQILRTFTVVFRLIHHFLYVIAQSDDPSIGPIPGMSLGYFNLRMSSAGL
jgi:hypothetical protein